MALISWEKLKNCRDKPIFYSVFIFSVVIGELVYTTLQDNTGFFNFSLLLFAISSEPLIRCIFDCLQEFIFVCCVKRDEPARYEERLRPVLDSWKAILLGLTLGLVGMIMYWSLTETDLLTVPNVMKFLGAIAIGSFFKYLIITKRVNANQRVDNNSRNITFFENMYMICWDYFHSILKSRLTKFLCCNTFTEDPVPEGSKKVKLNLNKIILLVSTFEIDENLHMYDNTIEETITDVEGFPVYKWNYLNEDYQYIIIRTQKPREIIQQMCINGTVDSVHEEDFSEQMKLFFSTIKAYFLENEYTFCGNVCIPVFVEKQQGLMGNEWLVQHIMESIRKDEALSIGRKSEINTHLPCDETNQVIGEDNGSNNALHISSDRKDQVMERKYKYSASRKRNRSTFRMQTNGIANQRNGVVPDQIDGTSNLQRKRTTAQGDSSSPVDPTPSCNDALDHISDVYPNHTTPLLGKEKDSTAVIDKKNIKKTVVDEKSAIHGEKTSEHACQKPPLPAEMTQADDRPTKAKEVKLPNQDNIAVSNALHSPSNGKDQVIVQKNSTSRGGNLLTSQVQHNGKANQRTGIVPDREDGTSNLQQTTSQEDSSSPVDPTPNCNDALDDISDVYPNHTTPLIGKKQDSTTMIDKKNIKKKVLDKKPAIHGEKTSEHSCQKPPVHTENALADDRSTEAKLPSQIDESQQTSCRQSTDMSDIVLEDLDGEGLRKG